LKFRTANERDLERIRGLLSGESVIAPESLAGSDWYVLEGGGQIQACGALRFEGDEAVIHGVAVEPARRRQGLAEIIVGSLLKQAAASGLLRVRTMTHCYWPLVRRGFRLTGRDIQSELASSEVAKLSTFSSLKDLVIEL
jgi:N-acetylglutamate synthase-like GNAT family acetyltransferase